MQKKQWTQEVLFLLLLLLLLRAHSEVHLFCEIFDYVALFQSNHRGSHIPSLWMVHAGCVFVASIHLWRTWMSGSCESAQWNACVHRLDLGLYSHLKEFWGNGVRTSVYTLIRKSFGGMESEPILTPKEKSPLLEVQRRVEPMTLHHTGQRAQHTINWAIPAPSGLVIRSLPQAQQIRGQTQLSPWCFSPSQVIPGT